MWVALLQGFSFATAPLLSVSPFILIGQAGKISARANNYFIAVAALLLVGFGLYQLWLGGTFLLSE